MGTTFSFVYWITISLLLTTCASVPRANAPEASNWRTQLELPALSAGEQVEWREGYAFSFDVANRVPRWVAYSLTRERTSKTENKRKRRFKNDFRVPEAAKEKDYRSSKYDRGHLAPAADLQYSDASMADSFLMTNTAPQTPHFNRGVWKSIEHLVWLKAKQSDEIFITTGPVLTEECLEKLAKSICVARRFFKVVVAVQGENLEATAFLVDQSASQADVKPTSIDEVEKVTGLDFFPQLPDSLEDPLESGVAQAIAHK